MFSEPVRMFGLVNYGFFSGNGRRISYDKSAEDGTMQSLRKLTVCLPSSEEITISLDNTQRSSTNML